jgi:hypothetical protein
LKLRSWAGLTKANNMLITSPMVPMGQERCARGLSIHTLYLEGNDV